MLIRSKKSVSRRQIHQNIYFYIFLAPALIGFVLLTCYPLVRSLLLSFTNRELLYPEFAEFIGFANYVKIFKDPYVGESLITTFKYALIVVPLVNIIAIGAALLMNMKNKLIPVFRTIFYIPSLLPVVATVIMFSWIFDPAYGCINTFLHDVLGISQDKLPMWLLSSKTALGTIIVMGLWGFGGKMIIYLAGLQGISKDYYEAASIDGAGKAVSFFKITLPLLLPSIFYNVLIGSIAALQVFSEAYVVAGGRETGTLFYVFYIYNTVYINEQLLGYGSALSWVLFIITSIVSVIYFRINSKLSKFVGDV